MAAPKNRKKEVFQPSRAVKRIIPCLAGWAFITDELGKTHHLKVDSDEFSEICLKADEFFDGLISRELQNLGWSHVTQRMTDLSSEALP